MKRADRPRNDGCRRTRDGRVARLGTSRCGIPRRILNVADASPLLEGSSSMRLNRFLRTLGVLTTATVAIRCSSSSSPSNPTPTPAPTPTPTLPAVTTVVTGVQAADGTQATQQTGTPPAAHGGAPITAAPRGTGLPPRTAFPPDPSGAPLPTVQPSGPDTP